MKRSIFMTGVVTALVFTTACGVKVSEGTVTDKIYTEPHTTEEEVMEYDCDTKYRTIGGKRSSYKDCGYEGTGEFETVEHPAVYEFELTDKQGNTDIVEVPEDVYNETNINQWYKVN